MRKTKSQIASVLLVIFMLSPSPVNATTVIVFATSHGLVMSTDSKMSSVTTFAGNTSRIGEETTKKFVLVQDRIVVASLGHADIRRGPTHYNFLSWMEKVQVGLPKGISVADLASTIEKESAKVFATFDAVLKEGALKRDFAADTCSPFVDYIIAGYQNGAPRIYVVQFYVDWNENKFVGPRRIRIDSGKAGEADLRVYSFGFKEAIKDILDPKSYAYEQAMARDPKAFGDVLAQSDVSLDETVSLARVLIQIEENTNPGDVGGDVQIVKVLPNGRAYDLRK